MKKICITFLTINMLNINYGKEFLETNKNYKTVEEIYKLENYLKKEHGKNTRLMGIMEVDD